MFTLVDYLNVLIVMSVMTLNCHIHYCNDDDDDMRVGANLCVVSRLFGVRSMV